jgi:hypothetical protein
LQMQQLSRSGIRPIVGCCRRGLPAETLRCSMSVVWDVIVDMST